MLGPGESPRDNRRAANVTKMSRRWQPAQIHNTQPMKALLELEADGSEMIAQHRD